MVEEKFDDLLTPMQIWGMVFHPSKGAVAVINKSIKELCDEMKTLETNLRKYNGLPERIEKVEIAVNKQKKLCESVQQGKAVDAEKDEAVQSALEEAREKGAEEQRENFNKAILLWGKILATITALTGLITWFFDLWNF